MDSFTVLLLVAGSTFFIVVMLQQFEGPFDVFLRIREWIGVGVKYTFLAKLWACPYCLSTWVSLPLLIIIALIAGKDALPFPLLFPFYWMTSIAITSIMYAMFD